MITRVLDTFRPGKFILTVFANKTSIASRSHAELCEKSTFASGYGHWVRADMQYSSFRVRTEKS